MAVIEGDPFGDLKPDKKDPYKPPQDVNRDHYRSDVDSSTTAQHHTLGASHNQAAYGDHTHNGSNSKKIGNGTVVSITGSRSSGAAFITLIAELSKYIEISDGTSA